ncbi:hypothetical protein WJX79_001415 [Trebouxia sp. C0005]
MTAYKVQGATILGSKPTCKAPANVEVVWPNIVHGFCASQRVDPATLLRGLTPEALKDGFTRPAVEAEADKVLAERDPVAAAVDLFDRGMTQAENVAFSVIHKPKGKSKAKTDGSQAHFWALSHVNLSTTPVGSNVALSPPSLLSKVAVHYSEVFEHAVSVMWS